MPKPYDRLSELQLLKLLQAVNEKDTNRISKLVRLGIPNLINYQEPVRGHTCLFVAARGNHDDVVSHLLELGAECDTCDADGCSVVTRVAEYGHYQTLALILNSNQSIDLQCVDKLGRNIVHYCLCPTMRHLKCLKLVLQCGADPHIQGVDGKTALMKACREGVAESVQELINANVDVNLKSHIGESAIHYACAYGFVDCVRLLIKAGADIDLPDRKKKCPIHKAARGGFVSCVLLLSAYDVDMNVLTEDNETAIHCAAKNDHANVVKLLGQRGCPATVKNKLGQTAKMVAKEKGYKGVLSECKKAGANKGIKPGTQPFLVKLYDWLTENEEFLLKEIEIRNYSDKEYDSEKDEIDIQLFCDLLLVHGPPVSKHHLLGVVKKHETSTHKINLETFFSAKKFINKKFLLNYEGKRKKKGKKKGKKNGIAIYTNETTFNNYIRKEEQMTDCMRFSRDVPPRHPLHDDSYWYSKAPGKNFTHIREAIKTNDLSTLNTALENGYNSNRQDRFFKTPLMIAALEGNLSAVQSLLNNGAEINATDNFEWTALHFACHIGQLDIVEWLLDSGASIDAQSSNGGTPLMRAVESSQLDVVRCLLQREANVDLRNKSSDSALDIAYSYSLQEIINAVQERLDQINTAKRKQSGKKKRVGKLSLASKVHTEPLTTKARNVYKLRHDSIVYRPKQAWIPQPTTEDLLVGRASRRKKYGDSIDFHDNRRPFVKHIDRVVKYLERSSVT